MASITITNHVAKAYTNNVSWTKMTWWKTSFNMPVPNIFDNNTWYTETTWMLTATWEATSFDLTWFDVGWEICCLSSVYTIYWDFAWGTVNCKQEWKNPSWTVIWTQNRDVLFPALAAGAWSSYQLAYNIWVASWEINAAWDFSVVSTASWAISWSDTDTITFSNVPSTATTYTPWYLWIEWNDLRFVSANWNLHTITWYEIANPSATAWYLWNYSNNTYWTGTSWKVYTWQYAFKQFASAFSNWPSPWTVSWATAWYTWIDSNFWYEHIWYIATDWYKYILMSWENPYA
jgi:hypothetical protein